MHGRMVHGGSTQGMVHEGMMNGGWCKGGRCMGRWSLGEILPLQQWVYFASAAINLGMWPGLQIAPQ